MSSMDNGCNTKPNLANAISGSDGLIQVQADLVMDSNKLVGAWELAKGAAEGLLTSIGGKLEPSVVKLLNAFDAATPTIQKFIDALFEGDWAELSGTISALANTIKDKLVSAVKTAAAKISTIDWGSVGVSAGKFLANGINQGITLLKDIGKTVSTWFESSGGWTGVGNRVAGLFKQGWSVIQNFGKLYLDGLNPPVDGKE